ncbi:MAG: hypoxanthine phosphoribosyltransferase [Deltaproteobacteria bacterium]|nr:hypoxanthine phosphoribosyltransferase [Deltaproteobacteria bacterium]
MDKKILFTRQEIERRVAELGERISRDFEGKELLLVGVLKGSFIFCSDLIRALTVPAAIDFVRLASYGAQTVSSGAVTITKDIETSIEGKHVIVVDDIVDSGLSLALLKDILVKRRPKSLSLCVFIDKRTRRQVELEVDYVGFTIDDGFVVGYGLDMNERFRELPEICVVDEGKESEPS